MALPLWIEFFEDLQNVRGRSRNTIMAYRRDLELYDEYLKISSHLPGFYDLMKKRGLSVRSQARVLSCIRTYLRFCESRGHKSPQIQELHLPRVHTKLPQLVSIETFYKLFDSCKTENLFRTARNEATLLLLFGLGCRVSELISLNLSDYHATDLTITITGKGGKQRIVPLTANLNQELQVYLKEIRPHLVNPQTGPTVIVNDRKRRPSRVDIWRWLSSWSKRAGFEEPVSPHQFRHGCATSLLEAGADLRSIQLLLGHRSIQTTQIYTTVTSKTLSDTINHHHPLSSQKV